MIDVLLVLLIIFLVLMPLTRRALDVQLPQPAPSHGLDAPSLLINERVLPDHPNESVVQSVLLQRDRLETGLAYSRLIARRYHAVYNRRQVAQHSRVSVESSHLSAVHSP